MLEVLYYTLGWLLYSQISVVHMAVGKSVNIRAIPRYSGNIPM